MCEDQADDLPPANSPCRYSGVTPSEKGPCRTRLSDVRTEDLAVVTASHADVGLTKNLGRSGPYQSSPEALTTWRVAHRAGLDVCSCVDTVSGGKSGKELISSALLPHSSTFAHGMGLTRGRLEHDESIGFTDGHNKLLR